VRRQLALLALATTSVVVIAFLVPLAVLVQRIVEDRAINAAEAEARTLAPIVASVHDPSTLSQVVASTAGGGPGPVTVFLPSGGVVGSAAPSDANVSLARAGRSFSAATAGGVAVFVPVVIPSSGNAVVRVFVPDGRLHQGVVVAWLLLALVGVALVGLAVLVADRIAGSIVQPTRALALAAQRLSEGELATRVDPAGPAEVVELGRTFNTLAARIQELLAAEREAAADLSHRLRTPLTALRLQVERQRDGAAKDKLVADVDALERTVDAVITELRRHTREGVHPESDLAAVTRRRVEFWAALAEDQGRVFALHVAPGQWLVPLSEADVEAAVDALLGNVFAHTPEGTSFAVRVSGVDGSGRVRLVVEDEGSGIQPAALRRGVSGGRSTGLGLDIVRKSAEAARGSLEVTASPSGGARVEVTFSRAGS
jgi:signal transduction histidine kinase